METDLIERAKIGDEEAFLKIYEKYKRIIFIKMGKYYLHDGDRDDLVQEGSIGLFKAVKFYDTKRKASFETFASLCINRQLITAIQRSSSSKNKINRRTTEFYREGETISLNFSRYNTPEAICLGKERLTYLKKNLETNLSKMEREVFSYMILGFSYKEIADKTGRKSKTIDNTMQRIKKKIKQHLEY